MSMKKGLYKKMAYNGLCIFIVLSFAFGGTVFITRDSGERELLVVMYHHLLQDEGRCCDYIVTPDILDSDISHLLSLGYTPVSAEEIISFVSGDGDLPDKPLMISFDDGHQSTYYYALPIAQKHGAPFVVSVIGSLCDEYTALYDEMTEKRRISYGYLTYGQLAELDASGLCEIGNHTYNMHNNKPSGRRGVLAAYGENGQAHINAVKADAARTQDICRQLTGDSPKVFAYPFGLYDDEAREAIDSLGFDITLSCSEGINTLKKGDNGCLKLLRRYNRGCGQSSEAFFGQIIK